MAVRRERVCLNGVTNRQASNQKSRLPLHTAPHPYHDRKLGKTIPLRNTHASPDPVRTQRSFYRERHKSMQVRPVTYSKIPDCFDYKGGDTDNFVSRAQEIYQLKPKIRTFPKKPAFQRKNTKDIEYRNVDTETQLIHYEPYPSRDQGVDMQKVYDIRKLIRRRYLSRKDYRKIFNQWDQGNFGALRAEDVHTMVNRFGIHVNMNEAKALLASANRSNTGALSIDEFISLIFDQGGSENYTQGGMQIIKQYENAVNLQSKKTQNQLKIILKSQCRGLRPQFMQRDKGRSGVVNFDSFCQVLNSIDSNLTIPNQKCFRELYEQMGGNQHGINYKDFISNIENFDQSQAVRLDQSIGHPLFQTKPLEFFSPRMSQQWDKTPKPKLLILDRQKIPVNKLQSMYMRAKTVKRQIVSWAKNKQNLLQNLPAQKVSVSELKKLIKSNLKEVSRGQIESFLSCFIYNNEQKTSTENLANWVFSDDRLALSSLHTRQRSLPPSYTPQPISLTNFSTFLTNLQQKLITQGTANKVELFKQFDSDKDGYINLSDIQTLLKKKNIFYTQENLNAFFSLMDTQKKGYIGFKNFSSVVQADILNVNSNSLGIQPLNLNISQPSTGYLDYRRSNLDNVNIKHSELRNSVRADEKFFKLRPHTRFGSTPGYSNTFMVPEPSVSFYASEAQRLLTKKYKPLSLAHQDKEKLNQIRNNKIQYLQRTHQNFFKNLASYEEKLDSIDQSKLQRKAINQEDYLRRVQLNS